MDKFILDHTKQNAELQRRRQAFIAGDPGALLCVEFYADRAEDLPPRLQALEDDLSSHGYWATDTSTRWTWPRRPASGAFAKPASGCRWP